MFYLQDSDDVYGFFQFDSLKGQKIQSQPEGRYLSLNILRSGGTLGDVSLSLTALYIPAGPIDPTRARDQVLNVSRTVNVLFSRQREVHVTLPIRNDAFLQNGAHFLIKVTGIPILYTVLHDMSCFRLEQRFAVFKGHPKCFSKCKYLISMCESLALKAGMLV